MSVNGNEVVYAIVPQTTPTSGIPTNPTWQITRRVDGDIGRNRTNTQSNEVDTTGQASRYNVTASSVEGTFNDEFPISDAPTRLILASVMRGTASADLNISATTIAATASGFTDTGNGFTNVQVDDFIRVGGFTTATINRIYKVTAKADNGTITTSPAPAATEAAGDTVTINGSRIQSGTTESAFGVQKRIPYTGGTIYETYEGVQFGNYAVTITAESLITTSYSAIGLIQRDGTTQVPGSTDTAASSGDITSAVTDVSYWFNNAPADPTTGLDYLETSFTLDNGLAGVNVIGTEGAGKLQHSRISVEGTLTSIATDNSEKARFFANERFNLSIQITDTDGNVLIFDFPQALYLTLPQADTGNDVILQNTGTFGAERDSSATGQGVTVSAHYLPAP